MEMKQGEERAALMDAEGNWRFGEWDGGEETDLTVVCKGWRHHVISCNAYYDEAGAFSLEITQPLNRAMEVFAAALKADNKIETEIMEGRRG